MILIELLVTVAVIGLGILAVIGLLLRPAFRWVVRQCRAETRQEEQAAEIRRQLDEDEKAARREAETEVDQFMTASRDLHDPEEWAAQTEAPHASSRQDETEPQPQPEPLKEQEEQKVQQEGHR